MTKARISIGMVLVAVLGAGLVAQPAAAGPVPPGADYSVLFAQEWCGAHEFGTLRVVDRLHVADVPGPHCPAADVGSLTLKVERLAVEIHGQILGSTGPLVVEATETITNLGRITADGVFLGDVTGDATPNGNGGAGHGSEGGLGVGSPSLLLGGGSAYGEPDDGETEPGSRGGDFGSAGGGAGGGQIVLDAFDISNHGSISANGATGAAGTVIDCTDSESWNPGAGGGSGGAIVLDAMRIRSTGVIAVTGGDGGAGAGGGGGGSGGTIEMIAPLLAIAGVDTDGGLGGAGLCPVEFDNFGADGEGGGFDGGGGPTFAGNSVKSELLPASDAPWFKGSAPVRLRAASYSYDLHVDVCRGADTSSCDLVNQFDFPPDTLVDQTITVGPLPSGVHGLWSLATGASQEAAPSQAEVTVRIDNDPPAQPSVSAPSPTADPDITLHVDGVSDALSGVARVECSNDSETWAVCGSPANGPRPWTIGATEGTHTVYVRVVDPVDNVSPVATTTVILTADPPSTTATVTPDAAPSGWYRATPTVTLNATDTGEVASITYSVAGATAKPATTVDGDTASFTLPADGTSTVSYFATDAVGQVEDTKTLTLRIDKTAPTGVVVTPDRPADHDGWYNHPFTAAWSGADATSGIAPCTSTPYSGPDTASGTLHGTCTDVAGNTSADVPLSFKYDATAPTGVTGTAARPPDANGWYNRPVAIAFSATDPTSGVASCTSLTYSGPDTPGTTLPGTCTDNAGNSATGSFGPLKYDGTGPTTKINGAPIRMSVGPTGMNGSVHDTVPTTARVVVTFAGLLGTVTRVASCTSGCGTTNATWSVSTVGLLGLYTVTARATDPAGNAGPTSNAVTAFIV